MGLSNHITAILNFLALLCSIPIISAGVWLASKQDNACIHLARWPLIILGVLVLLVSLAGFVGAYWNRQCLLATYLFAMAALIVVLLALLIFAFVVTRPDGSYSVEGRGYKEYRLGGFSAWLRENVVESGNWGKIRMCLAESSVCRKLGEDYGTPYQFFAAHLTPLQEKGSSEKRFRRRSGRSKARSNTGTSEPTSAAISETASTETSENSFDKRSDSCNPEMTTAAKCEGQTPPQLPSVTGLVSSDKSPNSVAIVTSESSSIPESLVIVVQTAIRGFLARKRSQKIKNVVKLQAAMRGHLVRRQAVATLRCVQAVVKMQALVRTRLRHNDAENLADQGKLDEMLQEDAEKSKSLRGGSFTANLDRQSSTEKLLKTGFAHLLLESTPKTKPIYISCDPSRSESAWKWLERWMAVPSPHDGEQHGRFNGNSEEQGEDRFKPTGSQVTAKGIANHGADYGLQAPKSSMGKCFSSIKIPEGQKPVLDNNEASMELDTLSACTDISKRTHASDEIVVQSDVVSQSLLHTEKHNADMEKLKVTTVAVEPLETEDKQFVHGYRKIRNPSFVAAKSIFEELSTGPTSGWSFNFHRRSTSMPKSDNLPSQTDSSGNVDTKITESVGSRETGIQDNTSKHIAEIPISSTVNSSKSSEVKARQLLFEGGDLLKRRNADDTCGHGKTEHNNSFSAAKALQKQEETNENPSNSKYADSDTVEQLLAIPTTSHTDVQLENATNLQENRSPQSYARTNTNMTELHGTPSSDISVDTVKMKKGNGLAIKKLKYKLKRKKTSNTKYDPGAMSKADHLLEDSKKVKGRNSLDIVNSDNVDQKPRISNKSPLPSYMQATQSARAKFHASNSLKEGMDSPDRDNLTRKKHTLSIGNGGQVSSPRLKGSTSLIQQSSRN